MRKFTSATMMAAMLLASNPTVVWAQQNVTAKIEKLSGQAAEAYREGDYEKSIALFKEAYELQPVSNLLFNIAKVYEKVENWDEAEKYYREFIKSPDADSGAREIALDRVDAIKEIKAAQAEANKPVEPEEKPDEKPEEKPKEVVETPPPKETNMLPWIVIGSGGALALTGGIFGILAAGQQGKFNDAETAADKRSARNSGKTFALVADIGYGLGIAAGAVGLVLLLTSDSGETQTQTTRVIPTGTVGPDGQPHVGVSFTF